MLCLVLLKIYFKSTKYFSFNEYRFIFFKKNHLGLLYCNIFTKNAKILGTLGTVQFLLNDVITTYILNGQ